MFKKYHIPYDLDDPRTTLEHRRIILRKPFLKNWYEEIYREFMNRCESVNRGIFLEVGSGGGFLKDVFPAAVTSDILPLPGVDKVFSAEEMPFENGTVGAILMLNVFHHVPRPYLFLREAERVLVPGGRIFMVEPANSWLGRFIYKRFHHEPFDEKGGWEIEPGNPLSNSNQALPFIYFERDREKFTKTFPSLRIRSVRYHSPFTYLASGGVSRSSLLPAFMYRPVRALERLLSPLGRVLGLFCTIEVEKQLN